jgi:hypothetical protein
MAQAAAGTDRPAAPVLFQPWLSQHLTAVAEDAPMRVAVRGTSLDRAVAALDEVGMRVQQRWRLVDIAVGVGTAEQVRALRNQPGLRYVEGDRNPPASEGVLPAGPHQRHRHPLGRRARNARRRDRRRQRGRHALSP